MRAFTVAVLGVITLCGSALAQPRGAIYLSCQETNYPLPSVYYVNPTTQEWSLYDSGRQQWLQSFCTSPNRSCSFSETFFQLLKDGRVILAIKRSTGTMMGYEKGLWAEVGYCQRTTNPLPNRAF